MEQATETKVTLAVLGQKIDHIQQMLSDHIKIDEEVRHDLECRVRNNERAISQMQQVQKTTTGILGTLQAVVAAVAVWLGARY